MFKEVIFLFEEKEEEEEVKELFVENRIGRIGSWITIFQ